MQTNRAYFRSLQTVFFCTVLSIAWPALSVTTNRWINPTDSFWREPTNWSAAQPPTAAFDYILITNAGTRTVTLDDATASTNRAVRSLTVSAPVASTNTLLITGVTNPAFSTSRPLVIGRGGILLVTNSVLAIGDTFDVTA